MSKPGLVELRNGACENHLSVCVLASGSRGNATYISDGQTAILVDAGLSGIEIQRRMAAKALDPKDLDAVLVSHEHSDHIKGVGVLSRRYDLPVFINDGTRLAGESLMGKLSAVSPFACGREFGIGSLRVHPFSISHDAEDPSGFTIQGNNTKIGIATDLGVATGLVKSHLQGCNMLVLEANHDAQMLIDGPYPWHLKQRIRGRSGHLSNEDTACLLEALNHERLMHVVLAHLSEENNTPGKARSTVREVLNGTQVNLHVATQTDGSCLLTI